MSIFLPDFDMGRLASRRKYILGREMLFAFSLWLLWVVVVLSCKAAVKPKSEVQQNVVATSKMLSSVKHPKSHHDELLATDAM